MMESQNKHILAMLKRGPVTPLDALSEAGCFRLAARIYDLRDAGHQINTELVTQENTRFARYSLTKDDGIRNPQG
jgi:hypothetical protein